MITTTKLPQLQPTLHAPAAERIVFFGTPDIAVPILDALAESPLRPLAVITEQDRPVGRGLKLTATPIKKRADQLGIPVSQPATSEELLAVVQSLAPTIGIVVAYGRILKPALLAIPEHGFVNLHFSLLPNYRGAAPIQAALLAGDTETGVTLMRIDPGLDTGPIVGFAPVPVQPTDTAGSLGSRLAETAAALAIELLPNYLLGLIDPQPQPDTAVATTRKLQKNDGRIDWSWPVDRIERFIRAMDPWPRAWSELAGTRIIFREAHTVDNQLVIDQIQVAGGRSISGSEFAHGYPAALTAMVATGKVAPHS